MAGSILLGIFDDVAPVADAVERIRRLGVPENRMEVMSAYPIRAEVLGRPHGHTRLPIATLIGTILGIVTALVLVGGTQVLYPIRQGGQPLWPIPPQIIILFEVTMLGTMWATFIGLFLVGRFPVYGNTVNDPRIQAGYIGLTVDADQRRADSAEQVLKEVGAVDVQRMPARRQINPARWWLWLVTVLLILSVLGLAGGLVAYDYLKVPWVTNMEEQASLAYEQGPRQQAPGPTSLVVPVQGPVLINDTTPGTEPVPADPGSLQRGQVLFGMHCALCHGSAGQGDGPVGGFMVAGGGNKPANLADARVQGLPDQQIYVVINNGFGTMPSLREDLLQPEMWDVVNHVRTLKQ